MKQDSSPLYQGILLSLQMICDELNDHFLGYTARLYSDPAIFSGCRLYHPDCPMKKDILYIVSNTAITDFPVDTYSYVTPADVDGKAPHIHSFDASMELITDLILDVFQRYKEFESAMNAVITGDGDLTDLCRIGTEFFRNPLYIHDSMFSVIALPRRVPGMLEFDENKVTGEIHIPLWLIDDFKFDHAYQETLARRKASIWGTDQYPHNLRSLFVNLWEGDYYYGRLLINELETSLKPGQFRLAEIFAEYVKMILRRDAQRANHDYKDHTTTLYMLMTGQDIDPTDVEDMLTTLSWARDDSFLCLKLVSQDPRISIRVDSPLRSYLAAQFPGTIQLFHENRLWVLFNLTASGTEQRTLITELAPAIRDSYVYAGLSNPVHGIEELSYASQQADIALNHVRKSSSTRWLFTFSDCMLDYTLSEIGRDIPQRMLIPPILFRLLESDRAKGTQYYETLMAYIRNERSIPATAKALFVHRTTLLYRLEKLQDMLKLNLDDESVRLQLMLAFRFMEKPDLKEL